MISEKSFMKYVLFFLWFLRRLLRGRHYTQPQTTRVPKIKYPPVLDKLSKKTLICDMEGGLLRSSSTFSYFMLVALESTGGFLRGLLLLILYPFISCLGHELGLRIMVMVSFIGVSVKSFNVGKAVLPKYLLEDVALEGFEVLRGAKKRVCVTSKPRVMVQMFLMHYLEVEMVIGRELKVFNGYYTGFMEDAFGLKEVKELLIGTIGSLEDMVWFGGCETSFQLHQHFFSLCKEVYDFETEAEIKRTWNPLPRTSYPKPLIFHDGRLAFKPTPTSTLSMFLWLPFGLILALIRGLFGYFFPSYLFIPILAFTGLYNRTLSSIPSKNPKKYTQRLYICNHRTLFDPVYAEAVIGRKVTAVTYSLSPFSELISPIKTVRLTRNRDEDKQILKNIIEHSNGVLVVCPEGTTCREPYILRFSPLFAEICDAVIPVALQTHVTMFYGTSTSIFKFLDPLYFFMNPWPGYDVEFLDAVASTHDDHRCNVDGENSRNVEIANYVQGMIGRALGFECTNLTRRDKYLTLAGNEGIVDTKMK